MWNAKQWAGGAIAALALAAAGCADDSRDMTGPRLAKGDAESSDAGKVYDQVDFLGNPLVSEVTIVKANHDRYNRTQPYNTAEFLPQTAAFVTDVAGRPLSLAQTLGGALYPDILIVDTTKDPASSGWLSWVFGGWGGRNLSDDVVDVGLQAIFGNLVSAEKAVCLGKTLPLCTDNVDANDKPFSTTFPYLAPPTL